jgi:hypothetical protein
VRTRLLGWIDGNGSRMQIISTSKHPLFVAVTRGLFDEALYYRLNVILVRVNSNEPPELSADAQERRVGKPTTARFAQLAED